MSGPISTRHRIADDVEEYTGKAATVDVVADPNVPGTYAVRARTRPGGAVLYFLWYASGADALQRLEEVQFNTWPPRARA